MYIQNTSQYPTEEVKKLIKFAANKHHRCVCVNMENSKQVYHGRAYNCVPFFFDAPRSSRYLIQMGIGDAEKYPALNGYCRKYKRVRMISMRDWKEAIVYVAAHEFAHIRQFVLHHRASEVEAEKIAYKKLMQYRESLLDG